MRFDARNQNLFTVKRLKFLHKTLIVTAAEVDLGYRLNARQELGYLRYCGTNFLWALFGPEDWNFQDFRSLNELFEIFKKGFSLEHQMSQFALDINDQKDGAINSKHN